MGFGTTDVGFKPVYPHTSLLPMVCTPVVGPRSECTVHMPEKQLLKDLLAVCHMGHW